MALTPAQLATLAAFIEATPALDAEPNNPDGNTAIANAMNLPASPDFWVYQTNVTVTEVGDHIDGTELAGLSTVNATRLQTVAMFSAAGVNASLEDRRQFFDDIFSGAGGAITRANLAVLWRRRASVAEKLYATGTGSTASPATMVFEGQLSQVEVSQARELP